MTELPRDLYLLEENHRSVEQLLQISKNGFIDYRGTIFLAKSRMVLPEQDVDLNVAGRDDQTPLVMLASYVLQAPTFLRPNGRFVTTDGTEIFPGQYLFTDTCIAIDWIMPLPTDKHGHLSPVFRITICHPDFRPDDEPALSIEELLNQTLDMSEIDQALRERKLVTH